MDNPKANAGLLSRQEAEPYLGPLAPSLLDSFWDSWDWVARLVDSDERARPILHSSTVAGMVSDAFGYFCRQHLDPFKPRWRSRGRFRQAVIEETVALRFKKLTPDLLAMNVRTVSQRDSYRQREAALPGARSLTGITLGYTLNRLATQVTGVYFTCPADFDRNEWFWPIYQAGINQLRLFGGPSDAPDGKVEDVLDVKINVRRAKPENG